MFPCDTLELLQDTAQRAQAAQKLEIAGDGRMGHFQIGGQIQTIPIPPPVRVHDVFSLEALKRFSKDIYSAEDVRQTVWHGQAGVTLLLNDDDRRDRVQFSLTPTPQLNLLIELEKTKQPMDQGRFIRLLRDGLGVDRLTILGFRRLDWTGGMEAHGEISHGRERMGKNIDAQVAQIDQLPEELDIHVPLYREIGERTEYIVRCTIDIDPGNQRLGIWPALGELDRILEVHQVTIADRLEELTSECENVAVYYGKP